MDATTFANRLFGGKTNCVVYSNGTNEGLVSVWMHGSSIVLTWEECPKGEQYDESTYTRDERHVFSTLDELTAFLSERNLSMESFAP
ncbi:MAG: hypothetical protein KDA90_06985 [Planctomycetaceae bacterium]|nr:hypothetical protein [Planctomycetaceae bacterium]